MVAGGNTAAIHSPGRGRGGRHISRGQQRSAERGCLCSLQALGACAPCAQQPRQSPRHWQSAVRARCLLHLPAVAPPPLRAVGASAACMTVGRTCLQWQVHHHLRDWLSVLTCRGRIQAASPAFWSSDAWCCLSIPPSCLQVTSDCFTLLHACLKFFSH